MDLQKAVLDALNMQMNAEFYSSQLYLSLANWFESRSLDGFAHWFKKQAEEERGHGMDFMQYILDRNQLPSIGALEAPPATWDAPLAVVQAALDHEIKVSSLILTLNDLSVKENDVPTMVFLERFVKEQVEEESTARNLVDRVKLADSGTGLLVLDKRLGKRE